MRRIVEAGHEIAIHTYSHMYSEIYASVEDYLDDFYKIYMLIQDATGVTPTIFRFPGGVSTGTIGLSINRLSRK
jgi:peptidoglycan/xylan/chitin deacetylase (PgdA/CDA1 family)